jgi:hypothetical protein
LNFAFRYHSIFLLWRSEKNPLWLWHRRKEIVLMVEYFLSLLQNTGLLLMKRLVLAGTWGFLYSTSCSISVSSTRIKNNTYMGSVFKKIDRKLCSRDRNKRQSDKNRYTVREDM